MSDDTKHSPEPWRVGPPVTPYDAPYLLCALPPGTDDECVMSDAVQLMEKDARRIVACVNACAGIPTAALEAGKLGEALDLAKRFVDVLHSDYCGFACDCDTERDILRALGRLP